MADGFHVKDALSEKTMLFSSGDKKERKKESYTGENTMEQADNAELEERYYGSIQRNL